MIYNLTSKLVLNLVLSTSCLPNWCKKEKKGRNASLAVLCKNVFILLFNLSFSMAPCMQWVSAVYAYPVFVVELLYACHVCWYSSLRFAFDVTEEKSFEVSWTYRYISVLKYPCRDPALVFTLNAVFDISYSVGICTAKACFTKLEAKTLGLSLARKYMKLYEWTCKADVYSCVSVYV